MPAEDIHRKSADGSGQESDGIGADAGPSRQNVFVADALAGDRKALAVLIETTADAVYAFLSRRIDREEVVEELCQDVFLAAWPQLSRFRQEANLTTWLCAIARHKVADYYRRRLQEVSQEEASEDENAHPETVSLVDFEAHVDGQRLGVKTREILSQMPERYRSVLRWRYWDHRSLGEIAEMIGKTEKAVERLLARSRESFARRWNHE